MKKKNKKQNIKNALLLTLSISFYFILFFLLDMILLLALKPTNINFVGIVCIDIGLGLLFSTIMTMKGSVCKAISFVFICFLLIFYSLFELVEVLINKIVGNMFSFSTIVYNFENVMIEYSEEIQSGVKNNCIFLIAFAVLAICFLCISKRLYIDDVFNTILEGRRKTKSKRVSVKDKRNIIYITALRLFMFLSSITFLIIGILSINTNTFDFDSNTGINGLKVAIVMDGLQLDDANIIVNNKTNIENTYDAIVNKDVHASFSNADIMSSKAYYYDPDEYNVINFDFDDIMKRENAGKFNAINEFIKNRVPTKKNKYTGLFKGKNLIMICAEAWNSRVVDKKLFPTMYRLINNGFKFKNFYQPHGSSSTSSGEYTFMTGMISVNNDKTFVDSVKNNMGFAIPMKLKENNYNTYSFHNGRSVYYGRDETHDSLMGFDKFMANDTGLNAISNQNRTDDKKLIEIMYDNISKDKPFLSYIMTYNGHKPYTGDMTKQLNEYYKRVEARYKNWYTAPVKCYIAKQLYLEEGLTYLINKLEEDNLLDDTVICMVPDHYPYGLVNVSAELGNNIDYIFDLYKDERVINNKTFRDRSDIILWSGSLEKNQKSYVKEIEKVTNTIDLTPTLLNLFGIEFDSRLYPGNDVFSDRDGRAIYQTGLYVNAELKNKYIPAGIDEDDDSVAYEIYNLINYCKFNVKNDYYGYLVGKKSTKQKTCYLTFDGGPTKNTKNILSILAENNIKATFFVAGCEDLSIIFDIIRGEHTLGIQSYFKNYDYIYGNDVTFVADLNNVYNRVKDLYRDGELEYMRFYGGSENKSYEKKNPGFMDRAKDYVYSLGLEYVDFNVDSKDENNTDKNQIVKNVLDRVKGLDDICILLHDGKNNEATVEALPEIIEKLREKGYRFKKITEYSPLFHD